MKSFLIFFMLFPAFLHSQSIVRVEGKSLLVDDSLYFIRGVCYYPVAIGDDRSDPMDFSYIDQDILLMRQAKINTIRTYVPIMNPDVLDKFAAAGIKIIMGFPNFDDTFQYPDISHGSFLNYINSNKNHDAILMWELGNEYNYHPDWFNNNINNWYTILNNAASAIHEADPNHPVSTAHGEVPTASVLGLCPEVDVWGMNVYRWDNPSVAITQFTALSEKPCYFSESGADRYNKNRAREMQDEQANADLKIWKAIKDKLDQCSGITYFEFVDEWWKGGNNMSHDATGFAMTIPYDSYANEEWWGIVDIERNKSLAYETLKTAFTEHALGVPAYQINQKSILFPNPASDVTTLKLSKPLFETISLNISSINGVKLIAEQFQVQDDEIEIPLYQYQLPEGLYFVSVIGKSIQTNCLLIQQ
ncbi:MAG: T9SS type A sorting domain-containing protein [Bacteroidales bacterium]